MTLSPALVRLLIVTFVALGSCTYGYSSSIIATTLGQPTFIAYFDLDPTKRSNANDLIGAINGLFQAGGLLGTLSCIATADRFGRRKALLIAAIICIVGGGLQSGSVHIAMYLVARLITGVGIGAMVTLVPLYQSEIAPPRIRGFLVGMHGAMLGLGYAAASWIGVGFYFVNASGTQWRLPLAIQCLWPILLASGILLVPETPRWLLLQDRVDAAFAAFKATRAETSDALMNDEDALRADFDLLCSQVAHEVRNSVSFIGMFRSQGLRRRCGIGFLTTFGAQCTATIVINNYGPLLYKSLGFNTIQQLLMAAGWISMAPVGNLLNAFVVDYFGRVRMLLFGFIGCVVALTGECITVSRFQATGHRSAAIAAVFFLYLHVAVFASTVDATTYIYASEIFPTPVRARGLAISVSGLFVATVIFTSAAPTAFAGIGWKYYLVLTVMTAATAVVMWFWFPETSKRSLEEVQELFGDSVEDLGGIEAVSPEKQDFTASSYENGKSS